ncbi:hypothetical protein F4604DRAFT_910263 [Suillus subluteus]|nr:hypothetical protein F4604DRAFT_910263 [Suillus subluteus]
MFGVVREQVLTFLMLWSVCFSFYVAGHVWLVIVLFWLYFVFMGGGGVMRLWVFIMSTCLVYYEVGEASLVDC